MNKTMLLILIVLFSSCKDSTTDRIAYLVKEWIGKEIIFPNNMNFTAIEQDVVSANFLKKNNYSIVTYADSIGCMSCKLKLNVWASLIEQLDSMTNSSVPVYFFLYSNSVEKMHDVLKRYNFKYPVCIDEKDSFNIFNKLPSDMKFQTCLLDKNNKVVAVGKPVNNQRIKEIYLNIISEKQEIPEMKKQLYTSVLLSNNKIDLGRFTWTKKQEIEIMIINTGKNPLVINEVVASCGCMTAEYDEQPIQSGKTAVVKISYRAEYLGHFDKTIAIHCNVKESPLKLSISGNAE